MSSRRLQDHVRSGLASVGLAAVALLFIAPLGGRAQACGFPAGVAPPGSYTITCENCSVTGFTLACDCLTLLQTLQRTSIDIADCRSQPANINGSLFCDHCSAQGACCFEDASCSEGSFATCEGVGDYRGDNSTCGQVLCLSATSVTWANPDGGAFDEGGNWAGGAAPGASDIGVFDLSGTYTVTLRDAPTIRAARVRMSRLTLSGDQLQLAGASTSALRVGDAAELSLAGTTVTAPRVAVGDTGAERAIVRVQPGAQLTATQALAVGGLAAATVEILGGGVTTGDLTVGGPEDGGGPALLGSAPTGAAATGGPRAVDDPEGLGPILRVTRSGASSGTLQASQVTFGPGGLGEAVVEAGARANVSGATTIGTGGKGLLRVRGPQSLWESGGSLVVGDDGDGTLTVYTGGRVKAADMTLGARAGGEGVAEVVGTSAISKLESTNALVVGGEGLGTLNVSEFGEVTANDLFVGTGVGGEGAVTVGASGKIVVGRLSLGAFEPSGGRGTLRIEGSGRVETGSTTVGSGVVAPSTIEVAGSLDAQTFNLLDSGTVEVQGGGTIESQFAYVQGLLSVTGGGWLIASVNLFVQEGGVLEIRGLDSLVESDNPFIDGVQRPGTVRVNAGTWQVDGNLAIGFGDDPPTRAGGSLILANEGTVEVGGALFCSTRCTIGGSGIVRIGTTEIDPRGRTLTNLGAIGPGNSPGTLRIEDNLELGASSRLVMEVAGAGTGQTDVLDVAGDLTLGGTLELRFIDGYAPRAGDVFPVLRVGGEVASAFSAVNVTGLEPGFELSLDVTDGGLEVTMQSDATPTTCTDPADGDGDGVADCADNCPETANAPEGGAAQADVDADGRGDACDPCFAGIAITKPILALKGGKLAVKGAVPLPDAPSLDPAATGVRLVVEDGAGRVVVDAAAPAGAFDRATKRGWKKLKYKGAKGDVVTSARLTQSPKKAPLIGFQVAAALAGVDPAALKQPLRATFVFDASAAEGTRCGEVRFTGPPGLSPLCKTRNGRVVCRSVKR